MKKYLVFIILLVTTLSLYSQEVIINCGNPFLRKYSEEYLKKNISLRSTEIVDTLELPFFDDFARITVYPDSTKWMDRHAFINDTYAIDPISIGVATLDAVDEFGVVYEDLNWSIPKVADYLTSLPINLEYSPSDSIYFSFYYQAGGNGNVPEYRDSLVLEFKTPETDWHSVWNVGGGESMDTFNLVLLPIKEEYLLKKGFQFRFLNYATVSSNYEPSWKSNADIWNIDYVMLDKSRSYTDTLPLDVAFVYNLTSVINGFESVPWSHYKKSNDNLMLDTVTYIYKSTWDVTYSVNRNFYMNEDYTSTKICLKENSWDNIKSLETYIYKNKITPLCSFPKEDTDSAKFELIGCIETDMSEKMYLWNDTVRYYQVFNNYYAYDDGTAEAGYGIVGSQASVAYRFDPVIADTLKGVYIYFNHTQNDYNVKNFTLTVWDNNNGRPGNIIYEREDCVPQFGDNLNDFVFYALDEEIIVNSTFFIGWQKVTNDVLNCGFDLNRMANDKLFYNVTGEWVQSTQKGALMLRPVFGHAPKANNDIIYTQLNYDIYPNPASDYLNISSDNIFTNIEIYDASGKLVLIDGYTDRVNIRNLNSGIYYIHLKSETEIFKTKKFVVLK